MLPLVVVVVVVVVVVGFSPMDCLENRYVWCIVSNSHLLFSRHSFGKIKPFRRLSVLYES